MTEAYTLTLQCSDRKGLVADVAGFLTEHDANITDAQQYHDPSNGRFFMRVEFEAGEPETTDSLSDAFRVVADKDSMDWKIRAKSDKTKVLIMVSKLDHCFGDLLYRWRHGEFDMDVVAIASNHPKQDLTASDN